MVGRVENLRIRRFAWILPIAAIVATLQVGCTLSREDSREDAAPSDGLALVDATVVDVADGSTHAGMTIIVSGKRIRQVGPNATTPVPPGFRHVDVRGQFLIPGLWDFHAHSDSDEVVRRVFFPLLIANGVKIPESGDQELSADIDVSEAW